MRITKIESASNDLTLPHWCDVNIPHGHLRAWYSVEICIRGFKRIRETFEGVVNRRTRLRSLARSSWHARAPDNGPGRFAGSLNFPGVILGELSAKNMSVSEHFRAELGLRLPMFPRRTSRATFRESWHATPQVRDPRPYCRGSSSKKS